MKYMVRRTSGWDDKAPPCPEARKETYTRIDERTVNSPEKIPDGWRWFSGGRNHRVEHGHIMRDFDDEGWFIDIKTLDELMAFIDKYGSVVIEPYFDNYSIMVIEIYDDYRE